MSRFVMRRIIYVRLMLVFGVALAALGSVFAPHVARAAAFSAGNLVVVRVGDGTGTLSSAAAAVFLDEYTGGGTFVQSVALPTAVSGANARLTVSGTANSEGALARSADGRYLTLAGYDAAVGTAGVKSLTSSVANRVVARVDSAGAVDTSTRISDGYSTDNVRGAVTDDGTRFWTSGTGTGGGTRFVTLGNSGATTQLANDLTNTRTVNIFGGQLYSSSASSTFQGVSTVGTGLPTTNGQTTTLLPGFPTASGPQPYAFVLFDLSAGVAGLDTAYVADDGTFGSGSAGLQKWTFNGTTWALAYTISAGLSSGLRGLTGTLNGSSATLYATTSDNKLVSVTDTGAGASFATLASAAANTLLRGVALAPTGASGPTNAPVAASCPAQTANAGVVTTGAISASDADGTVTSATLNSVTPTPSAGTISVAAGAAGGTLSAAVSASADVALGSYTLSVTFANNDTPTAQATTCTFTLTVGDGTARIRDIQGAAHRSPLTGQQVKSVPGIVTATRSNGFYFQDPSPDTSDATSEGIFVFTSSAPTVSVGDSLLVNGTVTEFRPTSASGPNLTTTEIGGSLTVQVVSTGNALPAATVIGTGGRVPPTQVIKGGVSGDVETGGTFDPAANGLDFYESLEGMRAQVNNAAVVGPTTSNGEIAVVADNGANAATRTARGGIIIAPGDFNPERIFLDDELFRATTPQVVANVGDRFSAPIVGVLDYSFGNFKLQTAAPPAGFVAGNLAREVAAAPAAAELNVASFNVENLKPGDDAAKFNALASLIVTNLQAPDLIGVEEIQDNNGATNDAVVDASATFAKLISTITAAGGPAYQFRAIDPVDDQDGGEPGGNIRVGFLFRTDRGLAFVDRPASTGTNLSTTPVSVTGALNAPQLSFSPGRIDPLNTAFNSSRKPLAGEFTFNGKKLFVIANHFNSKGGDQPLFGRFQPPTLSSATQRTQQATIVNGFVKAILAKDASARVVVLGDFNDFNFSTPLKTLTSGALVDLMDTLPASERYTYVFDGNSQDLDHILVSARLVSDGLTYDVVHVNAEFADQTSDHDPGIVRLNFADAPVTPTPVTPTPVTPTPVTPTPVTPAPVTPAPVTPAPVTPAPVTPTPVTPDRRVFLPLTLR